MAKKMMIRQIVQDRPYPESAVVEVPEGGRIVSATAGQVSRGKWTWWIYVEEPVDGGLGGSDE